MCLNRHGKAWLKRPSWAEMFIIVAVMLIGGIVVLEWAGVLRLDTSLSESRRELSDSLIETNGKLVREERDQAGRVIHTTEWRRMPDGQVQLHGDEKRWNEDGTLVTLTQWHEGKRNGKYMEWDEHGQLKVRGFYAADHSSGKWTWYGTDGEVIGEQDHGP